MANPRLQVFDTAGRVVAENDDWSDSSAVSTTGDRVGAFKLAAGSRDAALLVSLEPGPYTAIVSGTGEGVALVEVYDASETASSAQQLVNLSTRGYVDTGDGALVGGFVVTGNAPKRVLVRGIGPSLTGFGVTGAIADPVLKIYRGSIVIAQNDNWSSPQVIDAAQFAASGAEVTAAAASSGAFPLAADSR